VVLYGGGVSGYSGTPLAGKLGIRVGSTVLLDGAPVGFELGDVPGKVLLHRRAGKARYDVALLFCPDLGRLVGRWPVLHEQVTPAGRLWVAWPKRASGITTDIDENLVRAHGLAHGRVDTKVCAIDATWSGLAFVMRLKDR
jgi:hypothetical protein